MPDTQISDIKEPLPWEEAKKHRDVFKRKAARQFLSIWRANKERFDAEMRWGEEIEYMMVDLDGGAARVALCADQVLRRLGHDTGGEDPARGAGWRAEAGNMMVEGVTHPAYSGSLEDVLKIEPALAWRRREIQRVAEEVNPSAKVVTLTNFPLLGTPDAMSPPADPSHENAVSHSCMQSDEVISPHYRFQKVSLNQRHRKGCKVGALIPREGITDKQRLTPAEKARMPFRLAAAGADQQLDPVPGHIYADSLAFGAGQCCTQVTFLCPQLEDARHLTDQFLVLAPLFLALTAATPFLRGLVADTDTRMPTLQAACDDRTEEEIDSVPSSRYSPNDLFIGAGLANDADREQEVNDTDVPVCDEAMEELLSGGLDPVLSRHVANLLIRDPVLVFEDRLDADDSEATDHWEQLNGTNWGTVRFKTPPYAEIGWRVEFRSPEVQPTDFENAAICAVLRVLAEAILEERWDLVIPMSRCQENDAASYARNAAVGGLFWFRESVSAGGRVERRSLKEILSIVFPRCRQWLDRRLAAGRLSSEARAKLESYMTLFEHRARGELPTPAAFLRSRLRSHAAYRGDGTVPTEFVHDLCRYLNRAGAEWPTELLGAACSCGLSTPGSGGSAHISVRG